MIIYNKDGIPISSEIINDKLAFWPIFYIDDTQTIEATRLDFAAALAAEFQAKADEVQAYIDADAKLTDSLITAGVDGESMYFVVIQFNPGILAESSERGMACRGALGLITGPGIGGPPREAVGALGFRCSSDQAISHLTYLSALLPVPA